MTTRKPIDIYDHLEPPEGGEGVRRVARFLWTDSESGEELSVEVTGGEEFFEKLESLGFKRLARDFGGVPSRAVDDPSRANGARRRARVNVWPAGTATAEEHQRRRA